MIYDVEVHIFSIVVVHVFFDVVVHIFLMLQYIFFDVAVHIFRCYTTYILRCCSIYKSNVALHSFPYVFATLRLKCSCSFGTGARLGNRRQGAMGSRGYGFRSILFRARGRAGFRARVAGRVP